MLANFEKRAYNGTERVWTGRYRNLHNLPHWHLENELICVEQGQATVSHNHQEYLLTEGDAIFLGSGEIHYIKSDPDSITAITLFDAALTASLTNCCQLCCAKLSTDYSARVLADSGRTAATQTVFRTADLPAAPPAYDPDLSGRGNRTNDRPAGTFFHLQLQKSTDRNRKELLLHHIFGCGFFHGTFRALFFEVFPQDFRHDIFQISEHSAAGTCHRHAAGSHTETVCD